MREQRRRRSSVAAAITVLAVALAACGGDRSTAGDASNVVRIGITPYFEYQPWVIADELGLDEEQGLDFKFVEFTSTNSAVTAAYRGDIDMAPTCHACTLPLISEVPTMRDWMTTNQFKGFILIGRKGATETFEELAGELGPEQAKKQILESLRGKEFTIQRASYESLLNSALGQVGMSTADIKINDFSDDAQAALAFMGGTGDFYVGSLPQEAKLLEQDDEYVNVGGTEVLGNAALWFSTMVSTEDWLEANEEKAVKSLAVWYRAMTYMREDPATTLPIFTELINKATAASLPQDQIEYITTELDFFATAEQARDLFYEPGSETYYMKSVEHHVAGNADVLPDDYDPEEQIVSPEYLEMLFADSELIEWVNSPVD